MKAKIDKNLISILVVCIFLTSIFVPMANAGNLENIKGFTQGASYEEVVPLKKTSLVKFNKEKLVDDLAYLASVPTAVFNHNDKLYSHPLIFYQDKDEFGDELKYKIQDASEGVEYFMDDWMGYCDEKLDELNLIGMAENELEEKYDAKKINTYDYSNPYKLSSELAKKEWSYSDEAVLAIVKDGYDKPKESFSGELKGSIPSGYKIDTINLDVPTPEIGVGGSYKAFEINEPYKYVIAHMFWDNVAIDLDLQLYDSQLGMADADSKWNIFYGAGETASSYVYNHGTWEVGVTYMPTQKAPEGKMESMYQNVEEDNSLLKKMGIKKGDTRPVEVTLFPGIEQEILDPTPYGCRDVEITLNWDNSNVPLGFFVLDPTGAETASTPSNEEIIEGVEKGITERTIHLEKLGETKDDERYKIGVFALEDVDQEIDFTIEYSWKKDISREKGDNLASATNGAVLASNINAPLLYIKNNEIPEDTKDALYKLGVKKIHLLNVGNYLENDVKNEIKNIAKITEYTDYLELYNKIKSNTNSDDVVFSTIDPWTYYYSLYPVPVGEYPGAYFFGPAAFIAAHHGAPVLIVDNHPELSQAVVWHNEFWRNTANASFRPHLPSVASMVLTGRNVLKFLESYDYDLSKSKEGLSTMITVADQFDIGSTWDRTFTGRLIPGRFSSTPVDISYWISRSVFYPALIFENPALDPSGVDLVNGSSSKVVPILGKLVNPIGTDLVITKEQMEENYKYPLLHTYNVYLYKFNEIAAEKHWGGKYTTANGIIPYETVSKHPIDQGAVEGKTAAYVPDLHETYATPFYGQQAGYSNVFSTQYEKAIENLNKGTIMWMESCHGGNGNYGTLSFWDPESPYVYEENPWRAYERPLISRGTFKEFLNHLPHMLSKAGLPSFSFLLKLASYASTPLDLISVDKGSTEDPDVAVMNPQVKPSLLVDAFPVDLHIKESNGLSLLPIIGRSYRAYGDGVVIDPLAGGENVITGYNGLNFDEDLDNLHSMGFNAVSCLIAYTYLHQVMIRHGTSYQILDPWSTSWYSGIWLHSIPRQIALGHTIGEAYEQGMAEVGMQYLVDQWWWDLNENVVFFGDPDLRVWAPESRWDPESKNHWTIDDVESPILEEDFSVHGHMPFGAKDYPNQREPQPIIPIWLIAIIVIIFILLLVLVAMGRKK